jgi:hypothetical protein
MTFDTACYDITIKVLGLDAYGCNDTFCFVVQSNKASTILQELSFFKNVGGGKTGSEHQI